MKYISGGAVLFIAGMALVMGILLGILIMAM
jgi:hypothetical protein